MPNKPLLQAHVDRKMYMTLTETFSVLEEMVKEDLNYDTIKAHKPYRNIQARLDKNIDGILTVCRNFTLIINRLIELLEAERKEYEELYKQHGADHEDVFWKNVDIYTFENTIKKAKFAFEQFCKILCIEFIIKN
jgi:hypothetical protein